MTDHAVFILTKPPESPRARLCLELVKRSPEAVLYLVGDGVYCIWMVEDRPRCFACQEDMLARGVKGKASVPEKFFDQLVDEIMERSEKVYVF